MKTSQIIGAVASVLLSSSVLAADGLSTEETVSGVKLKPEKECVLSEFYRPVTGKKLPQTFQRDTDSEASLAVGVGNENSTEFIIQGKGSHAGYDGEIMFYSDKEDGQQTEIDTKHTGLVGKVSTTAESGSEFDLEGRIERDEFGIRSRKDKLVNNPRGFAKTDSQHLSFGGNTVQGDGAYLEGNFEFKHFDRDIEGNVAGFLKNQEISSYGFKGKYVRNLRGRLQNQAVFEVKKQELDLSGFEKDQDFTKVTGAFGTEYTISDKSKINFGVKLMKSNGRDATSPYAEYTQQLSEPLKLTLSYSEDLGNDSYEDIFITNHFVDSAGTEIKASRQKLAKASFDMKCENGDEFGVDLFTQTEDDAIQYQDVFDKGSQLNTSRYNFVEAKRTGFRFRSKFKLEKSFFFDFNYTYQNPRNKTNDRRMSYEPRRLMDVSLNYKRDRFSAEFSRRTEFDRRAIIDHIGTFRDVDDYSRSDLSLKYQMNDTYVIYVKVRDVYDEADCLRYNVEEAGRVILVGVEGHF